MKIPSDVTIMGDPHLGRQFKTGVPLHRVGEREAMQWLQFEKSLSIVHTPYHINMGDLFDKFVVAPEIVLNAAEAYIAAATGNPDVQYIILEGNHDRAKDSDKKSSFDIFAALVAEVGNITVVQEEVYVRDNYGFVPYHPFRRTDDLVAMLPDGLDAVFGHWDIQDWGGDNVIPTKLLSEKEIFLAISGHDHLARELKRDRVEVVVTGSMQPYTHAEDPTGKLYLTVPLAELDDLDVTNMNIRVLLKEGESLPMDLDCLSLTGKRISDEDDKLEVDTSDFDALDLGQVLARALDGLTIKDELMEIFQS